MAQGRSPLTYGILGYPVSHSLSPVMHTAAFAAVGLDAQYRLFAVGPEELPSFISRIPDEHINGFNVTIPYKERIIPFLNEVAPDASRIGAVNTVAVSSGRLTGYNTDAEGFLRHVKEDLSFDLASRIVLLIGAGGAARAVAYALCMAQVKKLVIGDLDCAKAARLVKDLKRNFPRVEIVQALNPEEMRVEQADMIVNATPVGMKPDDPCVIDPATLHQFQLVYDLIYNPLETTLLTAARAKGARCSNGLGMLLYQGVASFEYFTGIKAPVEVMREALAEGANHL